MASLSLPPPRKTAPVQAPSQQAQDESVGIAVAPKAVVLRAPSYEERCRAAAQVTQMAPEERKQRPQKLFVPRSLQDFDDGGAFPEIHIAQYPRHMGNPHLKKKPTSAASGTGSKGGGGGSANLGAQTTSRAIVNVEIDKDGDVSYDAIVKGGTNADKKVYSRHEDLRGGPANPQDIALPTEEEEQAELARTQAAFSAMVTKSTALDKASGSAMANAATSQNMEEKTQFIKYTPRPDAPGYNPAAAQRVIQMVPKQVDPMMPPKHKHIKAPAGPAEDPVPVLHAPPTKLSKEEREQWNIPACISNWKNARGYTIPLDKRLAADGRGLREHTINSNFATLSESLYVAERQARTEVKMRSQVQKKLALQDKDRREEDLRQLANQARLERGGGGAAPAAAAAVPTSGDGGHAGQGPVSDDDGSDIESVGPGEQDKPSAGTHGETEDDVAARQREKLRMERKREREKEIRLENNMDAKKRKLEAERDVSEKIALGVHTGSGGLGGDVDSRLYNQTAGMDSGFGAEDEYNTYSKPMFDRGGVESSSIYRPTRGETEYNADEQYDKLKDGATSKFQPDKGFAGAEGGMDVRAGPRTAPVQFEKGPKDKAK
jgi:SNW domain-containing protein 1